MTMSIKVIGNKHPSDTRIMQVITFQIIVFMLSN